MVRLSMGAAVPARDGFPWEHAAVLYVVVLLAIGLVLVALSAGTAVAAVFPLGQARRRGDRPRLGHSP